MNSSKLFLEDLKHQNLTSIKFFSPETFRLDFPDGTELQATYWRGFNSRGLFCTSFDHGQKYGLGETIDASIKLSQELQSKKFLHCELDLVTRDLTLKFDDEIRLQIFNFTSYEDWVIQRPDGREIYSNHRDDEK